MILPSTEYKGFRASMACQASYISLIMITLIAVCAFLLTGVSGRTFTARSPFLLLHSMNLRHTLEFRCIMLVRSLSGMLAVHSKYTTIFTSRSHVHPGLRYSCIYVTLDYLLTRHLNNKMFTDLNVAQNTPNFPTGCVSSG